MKIKNIFKDYQENKRLTKNLREIIHFLSVTLGERTLRRYGNLNRTREFIVDYFNKHSSPCYEEEYSVDGKTVANIFTEIPGYKKPDNTILIGAHYDTVENTPGADDNASAIAGLLELHRLLSMFKFKRTLRFVAFTLEEPPFYSTELMGSMYHAGRCKKQNVKIDLMICLEMIGYAGSKYKQRYPNNLLRKQCPDRGNFLTVVTIPSLSAYAYLWKKVYNCHAKRKLFEIIAPASTIGIDLSDNYSFYKNDYPAIMLTDTAFYRNLNYHTEDDKYETINFRFLTENVINSFITLQDIANREELIDEELD